MPGRLSTVKCLPAVGLTLVVGLLVAACGTASPHQTVTGRASTPVKSSNEHKVVVTATGHLLEDFEGLLHSTFGPKPVCARDGGNGPLTFVANGCSPLATYDPYLYTFKHPTNATLRLSRRQPRNFGNYPRVILIHHETIRCDTGNHPKYLVTYADTASFSLACLAPQ